MPRSPSWRDTMVPVSQFAKGGRSMRSRRNSQSAQLDSNRREAAHWAVGNRDNQGPRDSVRMIEGRFVLYCDSNGKLRYSWSVALGPIKSGRVGRKQRTSHSHQALDALAIANTPPQRYYRRTVAPIRGVFLSCTVRQVSERVMPEGDVDFRVGDTASLADPVRRKGSFERRVAFFPRRPKARASRYGAQC